MGLIKAAAGAIGGSFADQWKDFYSIPMGLAPTTALVAAHKFGVDGNRGSNVVGSNSIITNGSKFIVPEGYALILLEDGAFTGLVSEPGGYTWDTEALDSQSIFAGDGIVSPLLKSTWERFKFGGRPQSAQTAVYVSLQEISNNKFGSSSEIYWDDHYLKSQVGAVVRGSYSLRITDPLLFVHNFVPNNYLQQGDAFDFTDLNNSAAQQLFNEVVGSLAGAFSSYLNAPEKQNRMSRIQSDSIGFGHTLFDVVDSHFKWKSSRGLEIVSTSIVSIDYDDSSKELLKNVQRADALSGDRGNSNLQASVAAGLESAGAVEGSAGILGLGFAAGSIGIGGIQQPSENGQQQVAPADSLLSKMQELKQMLDTELISQADYDSAKAKLLGL
jgi:membrane protease subunit (stomatin/prohibitin family)